MPFVGQDWRSPGDQWVRTSGGWEKLRLWRIKVFENLNENVVARFIRMALEMDKSACCYTTERRQPCCYFNKGTSRECKELTSLSETLIRLDMTGAVKDLRRSNYVCKMLRIIFESKLPTMSGTSQKHFFQLLEAVVTEALQSGMNFGIARNLLVLSRRAVDRTSHGRLGSQYLWQRHTILLNHLTKQMSAHRTKEREEDNRLMVMDLPEDCLRIIFSHLADHSDIIHSGQTSTRMQELSQESLLWQQLCHNQFTNRQILTFLPSESIVFDDGQHVKVDWKYLYRRCYKRFGRKDTYADTLAMCFHCCSIYWRTLGHPCINELAKKEKLLNPQEFIKLFPL